MARQAKSSKRTSTKGSFDPFAKLENEQSVPIDKTQHDFQFTRKWFRNRNQTTFSTFLLPKFRGRRRRRKPVYLLQIGVYEGMDLVWQMQHIISNHPDSRALGVDPWLSPKMDRRGKSMDEVELRARHNLTPYREQIELRRGLSQEILPQIIKTPTQVLGALLPPGFWDLIVVDGDHNAAAVEQDAKNAVELAKVGGWIVFDDVRNRVRKKNHVKQGVEKFLQEQGDRVKLVWQHRHCDCYEKVA